MEWAKVAQENDRNQPEYRTYKSKFVPHTQKKMIVDFVDFSGSSSSTRAEGAKEKDK